LDKDLAAFDLDAHTLLTELIDTLRLAHEHDLELVAVGEVVDVVAERHIDLVLLDGDVDSDAALQVDDVLLKGAHLLEQLQARLVRLETLLLDLLNVSRCFLEVDLEAVLLAEKLLVLALESFILLLKRCNMRGLLATHLFQLRDGRCLLSTHLFEASDALARTAELLAQHADIALAAFSNAALPRQLRLHGLQVRRLHALVCVATLLVLARDHARCHYSSDTAGGGDGAALFLGALFGW